MAHDTQWVVLQKQPLFFAMNPLQKIGDGDTTVTDTTALPTDEAFQLPLYPRLIEEQEQYIVYRPNHDGYSAMQLNLHASNRQTWRDKYGSERGIALSGTIHTYGFRPSQDRTSTHYSLVDKRGTIVSTNIDTIHIDTDWETNRSNTFLRHIRNRRIVDFTDSVHVQNLPVYVDEVYEKGLSVFRPE